MAVPSSEEANLQHNTDDDSEDLLRSGACEEDFDVARVEYRKAKNREKVRRFRARQADERSASQRCIFFEEEVALQSASIARRKALDSYERHSQRVTADVARKIAIYAMHELKDFELPVQSVILEKTLSHPLLQASLPDYLQDMEALKHNHLVVSNINSGMTSHFTRVRPAQSLLAKDIVCTLASSQSIGSSRGLARVLGVDRRNLRKAKVRRVLLDTQTDAFWISCKRAARSDVLSEPVKELVIKWWTEQSTISPERKRVLRKRVAVKKYDCHPTHYIQVSQVSLFSTFISINRYCRLL
jgi:hypothetical protein